ncbi:hypothetical protein [Aeromonas media]|jgi:hypothetical protein|uniref:hypothetical protein n=1 Tax=Aeromonas media TaxID=651 RepID=UPI00192A391E|nr:hypothetical protein [Aeromonas media]
MDLMTELMDDMGFSAFYKNGDEYRGECVRKIDKTSGHDCHGRTVVLLQPWRQALCCSR